jgi:hypothetical protein
MTSPAAPSRPHPQLPNTAKKSNFPPPTTSTNYLPPDTAPMKTRGTLPTPHVPPSHAGLPGMTATPSELSDTRFAASTVAANSRWAERTVKAELGERREGSRQSGEERPASPMPTDTHVRERPNARPHRGPKAPVLHAQPGRVLGVLHPQSQTSATCPTPSAASKMTGSIASSNPPPSRSPSSSTPDPESPPRALCTLWIPEAVVGHLIGRVGRGLKLATDISKAHIAVSGPSTEPGAARKATIHGTSEEVGMALVVMGKRIAQQRVPNPRRAPKPAKRPAPTTKSTTAPPTMSTSEGRPEPAGRNSPDYAGIHQFTIQLAEEVWPTPPHLRHLMNRPPPHIRDRQTTRWSGDPRVQDRTPPGRTPPMTHTQANEARCRLIAQLEDEDDRAREATRRSGVGPGRSRGHASQEQGRHSPTAEYHARTLEQMEAEDYGPQTARWSGGGPSRGRGLAPRTDAADRTQPWETARRERGYLTRGHAEGQRGRFVAHRIP